VKLNGFLAFGIHDETGRIGYDLESVSTGERMPYIRSKPAPDTLKHGKYFFNTSGLAFGKQILDQINKDNTDLIIIDEIGPVELKGKSWAGDIERLVRNLSVPHLWVVRKPLLKKVMRNWPIGQITVADIQDESPETFMALIMAELNNH
jgi:nucleoside-triphosphatase THEP1